MNHVAFVSGGKSSWAAAKRVAETHGTDNLTLVFSDTLIEDSDLYRFLIEGVNNILGEGPDWDATVPPVEDDGAEAIRKELLPRLAAKHTTARFRWLIEGRDIWEVFKDVKFLANHRIDPCSRILKRELQDKWLAANCDPETTLAAYGFDWTEGHRMKRMSDRKDKWQRWAPLLEAPMLTSHQIQAWLAKEGIQEPALYALGFQHNNCGGGCVKAGQATWATLLRELPKRYEWWERHEEQMRQQLGDVAIMTDRRGGKRVVMTLRTFRERLQAGGQYDMLDWGVCGCYQVEEQ